MPFIHHRGKNFLYLHVPKTGGGSIEKWLGSLAPLHFHSVGIPQALKCSPQHLRMADFRALFGEDFFDHSVMTVRNPYDRIASEYRMRVKLAGQGFWKAGPSFSHWLEEQLTRATSDPHTLNNHLRPQWQFGGTGVEVLKFENSLSAMIGRMAAILGVDPPAEIPHEHRVDDPAITVSWDQVDRIRVAEFYARDFDLFGYDPAI